LTAVKIYRTKEEKQNIYMTSWSHEDHNSYLQCLLLHYIILETIDHVNVVLLRNKKLDNMYLSDSYNLYEWFQLFMVQQEAIKRVRTLIFIV
jgi:hypothetical protein